MKIALISDIHANLAALEAILKHLDAQAPDAVFCLGDLVGYGPQPNEVIDIIRARNIPCVEGNHDAGVTGRMPLDHFREPNRSVIAWTRANITPENLAFLRSQELTKSVDLSDLRILLVHSSPVEPHKWHYLNSAVKCRAVLEQVPQDLVCVGHTHIPGLVADELGVIGMERGYRYVVNPGAVGQTRDEDTRAAYAILDLEAFTCTFHRVSYLIEETLDAYRVMGVDRATAKRLLHVQ
jgi:putative phosphoesterase